MDLSQYGINTSTTNPSLSIPGLGNLQSMFGIITIASLVLGVLFVILYVVNIVQRMRADRSMIAMHKDIAAIKLLLEQQIATPRHVSEPPATPAAPKAATDTASMAHQPTES